MNKHLRLTLTFAFGVATSSILPAADHDHHGSHSSGNAVTASSSAASADAAWLAAAKAAYPLDTCVVSGEKLEEGEMGPPIDYVHKVAGQPDRLIRLCCKSCVDDFKKDPAKFLAAIDAAAAAKRDAEAKGHSSHH